MYLMKVFMKDLNRGEILLHKEDFCFVPKGKMWSEFNSLFSWGIILKYIPDKKNDIDYEAIKIHKEMEKRKQKSIEQSKPTKNLLFKESQLYSQALSPQKDQNADKSKTLKIKNNGPSFLNYENPFKNGVSKDSVDSESADVSNFEPEFLKNNDSSGDGSECMDLGKSRDNVFYSEIFKAKNKPLVQQNQSRNNIEKSDISNSSRNKLRQDGNNEVKEKSKRKAKENFLNASFIQPSRGDLDLTTNKKKGRENEMQK